MLHDAFEAIGARCTLVGGAAIEIHAPGIYRSGDIDVVIDRVRAVRQLIGGVFTELGFQKRGRHWTLGPLFVETPPGPVSDPTELIRAGEHTFRIVTKEVVLADRVVGFKQWGYTAYGQQAIDMISAFGDELDMMWLRPKLEYEDSWDAFVALSELARSETAVTQGGLQALLDRLRGKRP